MKLSLFLVSGLLISFLFLSCNSRSHYIEYAVENATNETILIQYRISPNDEIDSSLISNRKRLIFFVETGDKEPVKKYMNNIEELPFDFLEVSNQSGNELLCDPMRLNCWEQNFVDERRGVAEITLPVTNDRF